MLRREGPVVLLLSLLWGIAILLPFLHMFSPWLRFADYHLPVWAGIIGIVIFAFSLWLLWRSHADLGRNWSITLEIQQKHSLVTHGVFSYIRHPMYAAHLLWGIAQGLLIQDWIAGLAALALLVPLCFLRVPREERMMLEQFGEEYQHYITRTGRIIPRFFR